MTLKKKDFIEIDFTGRIKNGEVFDSTIKTDLEKLHHGHNHPIESKPFIFCLGHGMFLNALDDFLIGKEAGKTYEIELKPEQAFGNRDSQLIKMVPIRVFQEQKINPIPGFSLNFDGRIGKVLAVSGGRVTVDFNHSLAGKTVEYKITILRKITDVREKVKSLNEFFFRRDFKFDVNGQKIIFEADKQFKKIIELFADKFREILGLDFEIREIEENKAEKTEIKAEENAE